MRLLKIVAVLVLVYVGIVAAFESLIGYFQPADANTLVISTSDSGGEPHDRVVSRIDSDGRLYVAANHWPRAWYRQALENPRVEVVAGGERAPYLAVPVTDAERQRLFDQHALPLAVKVLTGFPPRRFLRLDPA
ncbi:MAG: nitroreductase/quinone reductase family protein [Pseudomonadales bacterium]